MFKLTDIKKLILEKDMRSSQSDSDNDLEYHTNEVKKANDEIISHKNTIEKARKDMLSGKLTHEQSFGARKALSQHIDSAYDRINYHSNKASEIRRNNENRRD